MNAARLLSNLTGQGFALSVEGERLIVSPSSRLNETVRAEIRTHKAELLTLLLAANDPEPAKTSRLYLVTQLDGAQFSLSRHPPATLAEIERDYPGARIEPMPDLPPAAALEGENLKIAYSLLRAWGEDDQATGEQWLDGLARDPAMLEQMHEQAVALGLARWEDVPTPAPAPSAQPETPRPTAICARCRHFERDPINPSGGFGKCLISAPASRKAGSCWPWPDAELHCRQFEAKP
jgi:hypothetical protein